VAPEPPLEASRRIKSPPAFGRSPESGALTTVLRAREEQVTVEIPVSLVIDGKIKTMGLVRRLGLVSLFVDLPDEFESPPAKAEVRFPVALRDEPVEVRLACTVAAHGRDPIGTGPGLVLHILAVYQKDSGLFERYVKFLYARELRS
jgi:hypothetical protein